MNFPFHNLKSIIEEYLDDLATHSHLRVDQPDHLRLVFETCRRYKIRLNPKKFIFCVKFGQLLGLIVSKEWIRVNPIKVEEILQLSPLCTIIHIQSLQGM